LKGSELANDFFSLGAAEVFDDLVDVSLAGFAETLVPEDSNFSESLVAFPIVPVAAFAMEVFGCEDT
jgi:hypothetical protein